MADHRALAFEVAKLGVGGRGRQPAIEEGLPQVVEQALARAAAEAGGRLAAQVVGNGGGRCGGIEPRPAGRGVRGWHRPGLHR